MGFYTVAASFLTPVGRFGQSAEVFQILEAASWLDAGSQAEVMRRIESIATTRIVIAHRLSTIQKAEGIYVLQAGRIVQHGKFDELAAVDGPFRELVQRQMT